jgi:circadian clock protein KaiC
MAHSNQIREFVLTPQGIELIDVYAGAGGVLTGSARLTREAEDRAAAVLQEQELERNERALASLRAAYEAELASLRGKYESEQANLAAAIAEQRSRQTRRSQDQLDMARSRRADEGPVPRAGNDGGKSGN